MKKLVIGLIAGAIISSPAFAKGAYEDMLTVCNYTDNFHLSADSAAVTISKLTGDEKVVVGQEVVNGKTSASSFFIKDTPACVSNGGYAHVRYQKDARNYCDLAVHDAENFFHPDITARCSGNMKYNGYTYDGINTHSYSLSFS